MDIIGYLKSKSETQQISDKFRKRDFVITDDSGQYQEHILFQLTNDKCSLIDRPEIGMELKVHFNLMGKAWKSPLGKEVYFNTLQAWRIEIVKNL